LSDGTDNSNLLQEHNNHGAESTAK